VDEMLHRVEVARAKASTLQALVQFLQAPVAFDGNVPALLEVRAAWQRWFSLVSI
jgi:hypothetical protein